MKYRIKRTSKFKKDYKLAVKRGLNISLLTDIIQMLIEGKQLPVEYNDHSLSGNWVGHRECHIQPDWLLVYYYSEDELILTLTRTGTHSDLFR
jgi:mRNA interferase YafQ